MNSLTFLNPALLWGLAFAAIPIIIHLLFRRRFRRIDWAPMHYLKLSIQRNRRRIRLEQLLLLLMRVAMILLLFFLVARPVMHAEGLGKWLGGRSRISQVLVIDDSLSMGLRERGRSALDRAQELAVSMLDTVGPKDHFTLVFSSQPKSPVLREVEVDDPAKIAQLIRGWKPADSFTSWEPTIGAIDELIATGTYPIHEITVITDLRRAGWEKDLAEIVDRWADRQVSVRVLDVGAEATSNIALVALDQTDRLALVGAPTHWEATIRNASTQEVRGLEADLVIDGKPTLVRLPPIPAGETIRMPLSTTFQEAGLHEVSFKLPEDDLPGDNERWTVVSVQESVHMMLVDGEPSSEPLAGEADFLALALSLGVGDADAFRVELITDAQWATLPAAQPDLLVLANVASFKPEQAEQLLRLVESGTGLMIFLGEQVDPDNYNQLLEKNGAGLLPAPLETIVDEELSGLIVDADNPGALGALLQLNPAVLERIKIQKYYQLRLPSEDTSGVRVLARWNNAAASPAVVEKLVGKGRVLLWTVTADKQWSDWPTEPSYVLAVREAAAGISKTDANARTATAGQSLKRQVPAAREIVEPTVERAGSDAIQPAKVEGSRSADEGPDAVRWITFADTRRGGLYKMVWKDSVAGPQQDRFAVNPDARESELTRMTHEELRNRWGQLEPEIISAVNGSDTPIAMRGQEIWRTLATGLLGLVALEACFATWAGRQR